MNRPAFELPPRSWTNFKGSHGEIPNRIQAHGSQALFGWHRRGQAVGTAVVSSRGEDQHLGESLPPARH